METNENPKSVMDDPKLAKALEEALRRNAGEEELADILFAAGVEAVVADEILAECQRRRGHEIGSEFLDEETLDRVAGGVDRCGGCTDTYYTRDCVATVEEDSWCWTNDRCDKFSEVYKIMLEGIPISKNP